MTVALQRVVVSTVNVKAIPSPSAQHPLQPTPLRVDKIGAILAPRCKENVFPFKNAARLNSAVGRQLIIARLAPLPYYAASPPA